jgi:mRNA-degrading endonuclease toxin of MazEF toxin-antitoxin module
MTTKWATKVAHLQMIEVDALSGDECTQLREQIRTLLSQAMAASRTGELTPHENRKVCTMLVEKEAALRAQLVSTQIFPSVS